MAITLRANGTVVAEANNAAVTADLGTNANIVAGDLILVLGAMRSTASGRSLASSGYVSVVDTTGSSSLNILYLLSKTAAGADVDPSVSPTGGISNEFVDAVGAVFAGASSTADVATPQSNAASQTIIAYPGATVPNDNSVVIIQVDYASTCAALSVPTNFTLLAQRLGSANNMSVAWFYWIQTSKTNVSAGNVTITTGGASAANKSTIAVFPLASTPPTFSVSPTVSGTTATSYTLSYTASTSSTFYTAAIAAGASTPTAAQIKAGTGGGILFAANEAVTGADTTPITLSGTIFPLYKLCSLLSNVSGDTAIVALTDQAHTAPAGKQYVTIASLPWQNGTYSILEGMSPAAAATDVIVCPTVDNQGDAITMNVDGTYTIATADSTYRYFDFNVYDYSAQGYASVSDVREHVNKSLPVLNANVSNVSVTALADITPFTVSVTDPDSQALVYTKSPASPDSWSAGSSVNSSTGQVAYPAVPAGVLHLAVRITGVDANYIDTNVFTITGIGNVAVPDVVGSDILAAIDALELLGFVVVVALQFTEATPHNQVVSQSPVATTSVAQGSTVTITVAQNDPLLNALYGAWTPLIFARYMDRLRYLSRTALYAAAIANATSTRTWARVGIFGQLYVRVKKVPIPLP